MNNSNGVPQNKAMRIVVVENDPTTRKLAAKWLKEAGHEVWLAPDGREAHPLVEQVRPDLVITDWE